jgi:hypothetical protein
VINSGASSHFIKPEYLPMLTDIREADKKISVAKENEEITANKGGNIKVYTSKTCQLNY